MDDITIPEIVNTVIKNSGGKKTGYVKGGIYYRSLKDTHFLRTPPAIAISRDVLDQLLAAGATRLCFTPIFRT